MPGLFDKSSEEQKKVKRNKEPQVNADLPHEISTESISQGERGFLFAAKKNNIEDPDPSGVNSNGQAP